MNTSITSFEAGKLYVQSGKGTRWSDFDGPFDTIADAKEFMANFIGDNAVPEVLNSMVVVKFDGKMLDLYKDENNLIVDAKRMFWNQANTNV